MDENFYYFDLEGASAETKDTIGPIYISTGENLLRLRSIQICVQIFWTKITAWCEKALKVAAAKERAGDHSVAALDSMAK